MGVPSPGQAALVLDLIDEAIAGGHHIYLHCWAGAGRAGTIVGCWLVRHGFPGVDALGELAGLRYGLAGDAPQTEAQAQFVKAWKATDRMMER